MKTWVFRCVAVLGQVAALGMAAFNLIVIQIDAQGAFLFIVTVPVIAGLCFLSYFLFSRDQPAWRSAGRSAVLVFGLIQALFFADLIALGGRVWAGGLIKRSATVFSWFTGYGPYAYFRNDRQLIARLESQLVGAGQRDQVQASDFDIGKPWTRICLMGPYLDEKQAARILGYWSAGTLDRTRATQDDRYVAVAFMDSTDSASRIIDIERTKLDLAEVSGRCYSPHEIQFRIERSDGRRNVARHK